MASRVAWLPLVTLMVAGTALRAAPNQQGAQLKQSKGTIFGPHQPQQPYVVTGNTNPAQSALSRGRPVRSQCRTNRPECFGWHEQRLGRHPTRKRQGSEAYPPLIRTSADSSGTAARGAIRSTTARLSLSLGIQRPSATSRSKVRSRRLLPQLPRLHAGNRILQDVHDSLVAHTACKQRQSSAKQR
jgi:hypothetical protein